MNIILTLPDNVDVPDVCINSPEENLILLLVGNHALRVMKANYSSEKDKNITQDFEKRLCEKEKTAQLLK